VVSSERWGNSEFAHGPLFMLAHRYLLRSPILDHDPPKIGALKALRNSLPGMKRAVSAFRLIDLLPSRMAFAAHTLQSPAANLPTGPQPRLNVNPAAGPVAQNLTPACVELVCAAHSCLLRCIVIFGSLSRGQCGKFPRCAQLRSRSITSRGISVVDSGCTSNPALFATGRRKSCEG
jgi:hypothetical protein